MPHPRAAVPVAVIGGGIGGLTAAIALARRGHEIAVFERAPQIREVGAALTLFPNALACLDLLGLGEQIRAVGASGAGPGSVRNASGRVLIGGGSDRFGEAGEMVVIHRADLIACLAAALPAGTLRLDAEVTEVDAGGTVTSKGRRERFGLVVAADGVHSRTRAALWPTETAVQTTAITAWRWVVDEAVSRDEVGVIYGDRAEFGALQMSGGRTYAFAAARRGHRDLETFRGWPAPVSRMLAHAAAAPGTVLTDTMLEVRPPRSLVCGRVALVGDSGHAMRPTIGQGAGLAIEDAVTLAAFAHDLPGYAHARRSRVRAMYQIARSGYALTMPGNSARAHARDLLLRVTPPAAFDRTLIAVANWRPPSGPVQQH